MALPTPADAADRFGGTVRTDEAPVYVPADEYRDGPLDYYVLNPASKAKTPHLFAGDALRAAWTSATADENTGDTTITSLCGSVTRDLRPAGFRRGFNEDFFHFFQLMEDRSLIFSSRIGKYPQDSPSQFNAMLCKLCEREYESRTPPETVEQALEMLESTGADSSLSKL